MKYSVTINQKAIADAGLWEHTDYGDWAIIEYIASWNNVPAATRMGGMVWINFTHLMNEMPGLKIKSRGALSSRIHKLHDLGLLSIQVERDRRLYAELSGLACSIVLFSDGGAKANDQISKTTQPVLRTDEVFSKTNRGVLQNEEGCSPKRTLLYNQDYNTNNQTYIDRDIGKGGVGGKPIAPCGASPPHGGPPSAPLESISEFSDMDAGKIDAMGANRHAGGDQEGYIGNDTADRPKAASGEENGHSERSGGKPPRKSAREDLMRAMVAWNELAERNGLPTARSLTGARKSKLAARLAECGGIDGWNHAIQKIAASPFLRGENAQGWRADFDFVLQQKSFTKLMEGAYDRPEKGWKRNAGETNQRTDKPRHAPRPDRNDRLNAVRAALASRADEECGITVEEALAGTGDGIDAAVFPDSEHVWSDAGGFGGGDTCIPEDIDGLQDRRNKLGFL